MLAPQLLFFDCFDFKQASFPIMNEHIPAIDWQLLNGIGSFHNMVNDFSIANLAAVTKCFDNETKSFIIIGKETTNKRFKSIRSNNCDHILFRELSEY